MKRSTFSALFIVAIVCSAAAARPLKFEDLFGVGRMSDPQFSPDGKQIAFVVTYYSLETNQKNSDIFLVSSRGGETRQLTNSPVTDSEPRFSPDGRYIAFTSSRSGTSQIWLLPTRGGEPTQLTHLATGASSPAWMSDSKRVVFSSRVFPDCKDDNCNAKRLEEEANEKVEARVIHKLLYTHWDHWRDDRRGHLFVISLDATEAVDLTPYDYEVPTITLGSSSDVAVSPDGQEICVTVNTDPDAAVSIDNDLYVLPASGGAWKQITDNPANDNNPVYSPDGRYIAYRAMSRPGFEADRYRLMLYDRTTGESREIGTRLSGKLDRSVGGIAWTPSGKHIYVRCADQGYYSIYRVGVGNGEVKKITDKMYTSDVHVSPDGKRVAFLAQRSNMPYELYVADPDGKNVARVTHVNDDRLADVEMNDLESFHFQGADGDRVQGWLLKPPGFDPARKYPMVFLVHGGPQGAWGDIFHYRWNYQMFAAPGYVVVAINPRGSTGFGQQFTDQISGDWGGRVYVDLMNGLDYCLSTYRFIDGDRLAAAGASYGGYMMNWLAGHSDRFKCLVNHDGVYNLTSMYGATEELWFPEWEFGGTPWESPETYQKWSPHSYAADFKTPMLVIHGGLDFRVPLAEGMQAFTALQRNGVPSKFLYFPDEGHWVLKPLNAQLWWKTVYQWIAEYIGD